MRKSDVRKEYYFIFSETKMTTINFLAWCWNRHNIISSFKQSKYVLSFVNWCLPSIRNLWAYILPTSKPAKKVKDDKKFIISTGVQNNALSLLPHRVGMYLFWNIFQFKWQQKQHRIRICNRKISFLWI